MCVRENAIFGLYLDGPIWNVCWYSYVDIVIRAVELNNKREMKATVLTWRQNEDLAHLYTYSQAYRDYKLALLANGSH